MNEIRISVIIPSWNHGEALIACLKSLEKQSERQFEVIVVDDGSTDRTQSLIASFHPIFPLRIIRLLANKGASAARNIGAEEARGAYLLFADADAVFRPHALAMMFKTLEDHPEAQFAYSSFRFGWKFFKSRPFDSSALRKAPYIHTTSLLRKEAFAGFDESLGKFQDWDLWLTVVEKGGKGIWIPEELFSLSVRKEGLSRWLPAFFHRLPWQLIGWMPRELRKYRYWEDVVKKKHGIEG